MTNNNLEKQVSDIKAMCDQVASAVGKKKEDVILALYNQGEAVPFRALELLLNPAVVFHIGAKSFAKELPQEKAGELLDDFWAIAAFLSGKVSLSSADIACVQWSLRKIEDESLRQFAVAYFCKDISLGVTAKTLNKAVGKEIIPEFRCMLANKYFDHWGSVCGRYFYLTEKLDGIRCLALVDDDSVRLFSRQGQPIEGLSDIENDLASIRERTGKRFALDGELLITNRGGLPSKEQYKRTTNIVRKDGPKSGITFNAFDILDLDAFQDRHCEMAYYLRRQRLETLCGHLTFVKVLPVLYHGTDQNEIMRHLRLQQAMLHEGVMINLAEETYQFKRTSALLKVKVMQDCDLKIIGVQQGQGKYAGTLGALIVEYKGNSVGVGSGLSDAFRSTVWENPEKYIGRVATIQYFEETNDADGKKSIRFPVFKELREEGKEVSYS